MAIGLKKIALGSDHGGYEIKEFIRIKLIEQGWIVKDFGTNSTDSVDYPDYIHPLAKAVNDGEFQLAVILCGSGNGAQMTANKYPQVRAALCWSEQLVKLARLHNNANILALPGRFLAMEDAWKMVMTFVETPFEGGRHQVRVEKISKLID
jgi:ribose 5-phosphate isomerase B